MEHVSNFHSVAVSEEDWGAEGTQWGSVLWLWVVMRSDSSPAEPVNWLGVSPTHSHATSLRCHTGEAAPQEKYLPSSDFDGE